MIENAVARSGVSARRPNGWPNRPRQRKSRSTREVQLAALSVQLEAASLAGDVGKIHRLGLTYETIYAELQVAMHEWAELA